MEILPPHVVTKPIQGAPPRSLGHHVLGISGGLVCTLRN